MATPPSSSALSELLEGLSAPACWRRRRGVRGARGVPSHLPGPRAPPPSAVAPGDPHRLRPPRAPASSSPPRRCSPRFSGAAAPPNGRPDRLRPPPSLPRLSSLAPPLSVLSIPEEETAPVLRARRTRRLEEDAASDVGARHPQGGVRQQPGGRHYWRRRAGGAPLLAGAGALSVHFGELPPPQQGRAPRGSESPSESSSSGGVPGGAWPKGGVAKRGRGPDGGAPGRRAAGGRGAARAGDVNAVMKRYLRKEVLVLRLRDSVVRLGAELEQSAQAEARQRETARYCQQRMQEMSLELQELSQREQDSSRRRMLLELQVEELSSIRQTLQADLQTSIRRIADLQAALEEESSEDSDGESVRTAVESFSGRKELDSVSSVGSVGPEEVGEGLRSWSGLQRGGSRASGSLYSSQDGRQDGRQSVADTMSTYSFRSCLDPDDDASDPGAGAGRHGDAPSSSALSELLEGLRRRRAGGAGEASVAPVAPVASLPIYQTTGASTLRRRPGDPIGSAPPGRRHPQALLAAAPAVFGGRRPNGRPDRLRPPPLFPASPPWPRPFPP
ncbi:uncharacterized protein ACNS7B_014777 [Menidia menidia]